MRSTTALLLFAFAGASVSADLSVLSAGAVEPGLRAAAAAYAKQSGNEVKITFNTAPQIRKRIEGGESFDVVIAPPAALDEFASAGKVAADRVELGKVGLGVAVRPSAELPDISSTEALRRSVLQADSVVFNRASTGIYLENLFKKMGIYDQILPKTTRYPDAGAVMQHLLKGKGREIGFGPVTEILLHRDVGLRLVGPLPADIQNYTSYAASLMKSAAHADLARGFVHYLGSPESKALLVAAGVD
ncbi:MAG TPA: substrate-binding domain-containing protein [Burkholderiales bacterium]|nr:substrate-binding domain-containing protein [Burkholderiales bacterium]HYA47835.1 substrate-binding domain-containing protein [Burkholderiales bacterium]